MVSSALEKHFKEKEEKLIQLIKDYNIPYDQVGVFGSYARGEYTSRSDIDVCVVTDNRPDRGISGELRELADMIGADIVFLTSEAFREGTSRFAQEVRKDFRRIL